MERSSCSPWNLQAERARIIAREDGPGSSEVQQAAIASDTKVGALSLGLCGLKRLVDEFEIVSTIGKGTTVAITKWKA